MSEQINPLWNHFIRAVQEEVKPALGCTEPVSLALACAMAAGQLDGEVTRIEAWVSPEPDEKRAWRNGARYRYGRFTHRGRAGGDRR